MTAEIVPLPACVCCGQVGAHHEAEFADGVWPTCCACSLTLSIHEALLGFGLSEGEVAAMLDALSAYGRAANDDEEKQDGEQA